MTMLAFTLEQLQSLGITPLEILTLVLVGGLITYIRKEKAAQELLRKEWHEETRAEVASLALRLERAEDRGDTCERDRAILHREVEDLKRTVNGCRLSECPLRGR